MLYLPRDPTPSAVFYRTARVYGAFTDLLVLRGRIIGVILCDSSLELNSSLYDYSLMRHDECLKYSKYLYKAYNEMNWMVRVQTIELRSDRVTVQWFML